MALSAGLRRAICARHAVISSRADTLRDANLLRELTRARKAQRVGRHIHLAFLNR